MIIELNYETKEMTVSNCTVKEFVDFLKEKSINLHDWNVNGGMLIGSYQMPAYPCYPVYPWHTIY